MHKNILVHGIWINLSLSLLACLYLCGCASAPIATTYHMVVDSINDPAKIAKKKYFLLPGNQNTTPVDLQFKEYAKYIDRALKAKGFVKVGDIQDTELIVFAFYGISNPKTFAYNYSYPVLGVTGGGRSDFTLNTYGSGGFTATQGSVDSPTRLEVVGQQGGTLYRTSYSRYLVLDAIDYNDYKQSEKYVPVWKTKIGSKGASGDLRTVLPALVVGIRDYIATNSRRQIPLDLDVNSPEIFELQSGTSTCYTYECFVMLSGEQQMAQFATLIKQRDIAAKGDWAALTQFNQLEKTINEIKRQATSKIHTCSLNNSPSVVAKMEPLPDTEIAFLEFLCKNKHITTTLSDWGTPL